MENRNHTVGSLFRFFSWDGTTAKTHSALFSSLTRYTVAEQISGRPGTEPETAQGKPVNV